VIHISHDREIYLDCTFLMLRKGRGQGATRTRPISRSAYACAPGEKKNEDKKKKTPWPLEMKKIM
jgi:hypothetical protein